jgi:hypothetical protein
MVDQSIRTFEFSQGTTRNTGSAWAYTARQVNLLSMAEVKVKLSLCSTKHHAMKTYWGVEVHHALLTSALGGGEWSASRPSRFAPGERASGTHWIGGCVGPRAGLHAVEKKKFPAPAGNRTLEPQPSSPKPVAISSEHRQKRRVRFYLESIHYDPRHYRQSNNVTQSSQLRLGVWNGNFPRCFPTATTYVFCLIQTTCPAHHNPPA